mgnify:CR=1 FL=1
MAFVSACSFCVATNVLHASMDVQGIDTYFVPAA